MPDISMCANTKCPLRKKCFRYLAKPDIWQSYALFEPKTENGETTCDSYWNSKGYPKEWLRNVDGVDERNKKLGEKYEN